MIGQINGIVTLINIHDGTVCILTQSGIGYTVNLGGHYATSLSCKQEISILIETIVKEDSITLYGFDSYEKQVWFKSLIRVSGVGTKIAINIIDVFTIADITSAIINQNSAFFQQMSGLGEKVSQRIITDLKKEPAKNAKILGAIRHKDINNLSHTNIVSEQSDKKNIKNIIPNQVSIQDVISALVNLGFDYNQSYNVAQNAIQSETTLESAIIHSLRTIGKE